MADCTFQKRPEDVVDYNVDWSQWLETGDTIQTSTWIVETGITQDSESETASVATIWVSGGIEGRTYRLINEIVTTPGARTKRQPIIVEVIR